MMKLKTMTAFSYMDIGLTPSSYASPRPEALTPDASRECKLSSSALYIGATRDEERNHRARRGRVLHHGRGQAAFRLPVGAVVLSPRPRAPEDRRGCVEPGQGARLQPGVPDGPPEDL